MRTKFLFANSLLIVIICLFSGCSGQSQSPYSYDDGLARSTPEEQGVPSETVLKFFQAIAEKGYDVHGLMMIRHGKVIAEHWWAPYAPQYQHAMYSATKTFTGMAVGFAVQEKLLSVDDKVTSFFPDLLPDTISPELAQLTVKHLLSMSVGHASTRYAGSGDSQVRSFLAAPFTHQPGTSFAYDITASHMLSHIITKVTGMSLHEYLKPRLLEPLGISDVVWEMDNDGYNMGNGGSHMRTSDLAKMGLFLLNKGQWNGKQLLASSWVETATSPQIYQNPQLSEEDRAKATDDSAQGYGYQTWMGRKNSFRAIGGQNQLIMVIPDYDFILVCHSSVGDEAGFNSLVYDMLPSMSDKKLKPNKTLDLNAAIAGYQTKRPFEGTSVTKVTRCTMRYKMDDNDSGINSVLFRFDEAGNCYLTIVTTGAVHNIPFGLDSWAYGMTDRTLSMSGAVYPNKMGVTPVNTAGICSWTAAETLSAHYISMFNPGSAETFRFTFSKDQLNMEIVAPSARRLGPPGMSQPKPENIVLLGTKTDE